MPEHDDAHAARELERIPLDLPAGLEIRWLGVSGYRLTYEGVSIFIDPYVSRVPLRALLLRRRALPDPALIERYAGAPGTVAGVLVGHTHFDHAVDAPALARRYRRQGLWLGVAGAPHAAARPRRAGRRGRRPPALRARPLRRPLRPEPALQAAARAQGADGRRADLRPPRRPGARRLQVRRGLRHPHRGRRDLALPPGQRRPRRRRAARRARSTCSWRAWRVAASRRATGSGSCPSSIPRIVVPTHYDNFFSPLGRPQDFVRRVRLADVPHEVRQVTRDAQVLALPRVDT